MSASDKPPALLTDTHLYTILPVEEWPVAAEFVCETVSPDAAFPNDPQRFSILAAINRATGEMEGMMAVAEVLMVDHYACRSGSGVSYSKLHELLSATLAPGTVYYTAVGEGVGARMAANRAGLAPHGLLMISAVGVPAAEMGGQAGREGEGGEDAVGGSDSGGHRSGRELPGSEEGIAGGKADSD